MAQEKKPVKGQEFLQKLGRSLTGNQAESESPESAAEEYEAKTKAVEAQDRYHTAVDKVKNPPSVVEMQKEQTQRMAEERAAAVERARQLEQEQRERTEREADGARKQAEEAERARKEAEQALREQQNKILLDKLEELKGSQKPLSEQFTEYFNFAEDLAQKMGFERPGTARPQSENPQIALEIAKINAESAQRDREFQLQLKESERKWDLEMIKLKDGREIEKAKLQQQAKRDDALFTAPQMLGAALAQGLANQPGLANQGGQQELKITAGVGDSGTIDCPFCHSPIGIGPTTVAAQCVGCNRQFKIERVPVTEPQPEEE